MKHHTTSKPHGEVAQNEELRVKTGLCATSRTSEPPAREARKPLRVRTGVAAGWGGNLGSNT
jgi:hypothetical protein